jgi:RNA polymerase sigma-70 factor (ECF subfamily)
VNRRREVAEEALREWPGAFGLAFHLLHDRARAEDVCQEVFLSLLSAARPPETGRPLRPLLLRMVRNRAVSELRRERPGSLDDEETGPVADAAAPDPLDEACRREEAAAVEAALAALPAAWRAALYLRDGLDLSYAEIAEVLERDVDVVRVTLHRARGRARRLLASMKGDPS